MHTLLGTYILLWPMLDWMKKLKEQRRRLPVGTNNKSVPQFLTVHNAFRFEQRLKRLK
jgi:hypothetical protein